MEMNQISLTIHATSEPLRRFELVDIEPIRVPPVELEIALPEPENQCLEWQEKVNNQCVCPASSEKACEGAKGGIVCDKSGNQYSSLCNFAVQVCNGDIPPSQDIASCGACPRLQLLNSNSLSLSSASGLKTFSLMNTSDGQYTQYKSEDNENIRIYFEEKLNKWIIGRKEGESETLLAQFVEPTPFVQESQQGAFVVRQNLSWSQQEDAERGRLVDFKTLFEFDPHLHLECINVKDRSKRKHARLLAFPLLFVLIGISVGAAVTSTTLAGVQKAKGCLYYPSVCDMRDEIKNILKPSLQNHLDKFKMKFGEGDSFKNQLMEVKFSVKEIQANVVLIKNLLKQIDSNWNETFTRASSIVSLIQNDVNDGIADIAEFDAAARQSFIDESIGLGVTILDAGITSASLVAGSLSSAAVAFSAVFSVLAIAFSAVSIALSVNEERKLRDKLRKSKSDLQASIEKIKKAEGIIANIQKDLNSKLVVPMKAFAKKVFDVSKEKLFSDLAAFLTIEVSIGNTFKISGANKITLDWLIKLQKHLSNVGKYTENKINNLRQLFDQQEKMLQFLETIKQQVAKYDSPLKIFRGIQVTKLPKLFEGKLSSLESLMHFVSMNVLPTSNCFMGFDLTSARKCQTCFDRDEVCNVLQLDNDKATIKRLISEQKPVCIIKRAVTADVFDSTYRVVKYIANFILPSAPCYWGYNLDEVRANRIPSNEINKQNLDGSFMIVIQLLDRSFDSLAKFRTDVCSSAGICNHQWQNTLLCTGNNRYAKSVGISCSNSYGNCTAEVTKRIRCPRIG